MPTSKTLGCRRQHAEPRGPRAARGPFWPWGRHGEAHGLAGRQQKRSETGRPRVTSSAQAPRSVEKPRFGGEGNQFKRFCCFRKLKCRERRQRQADTISAPSPERSPGGPHACAGPCAHAAPCTGPCVAGSLQGGTCLPAPRRDRQLLSIGCTVTDTEPDAAHFQHTECDSTPAPWHPRLWEFARPSPPGQPGCGAPAHLGSRTPLAAAVTAHRRKTRADFTGHTRPRFLQPTSPQPWSQRGTRASAGRPGAEPRPGRGTPSPPRPGRTHCRGAAEGPAADPSESQLKM